MNLSHLGRVRKERRKIKGTGVPLDSSLLMGDTFIADRIEVWRGKAANLAADGKATIRRRPVQCVAFRPTCFRFQIIITLLKHSIRKAPSDSNCLRGLSVGVGECLKQSAYQATSFSILLSSFSSHAVHSCSLSSIFANSIRFIGRLRFSRLLYPILHPMQSIPAPYRASSPTPYASLH